ncbi:MAG: acylglycerol lipase [Thermoleophilaceae bacterium]|nr:acylglycerol lipase [Thermoleophilaceae bacterium]
MPVATHHEGAFDGVGGLRIFWQAWLPAGEPRAVVVLAHGASEHSGRYAWTGERLTERGYALYALDHRGHGRSEGRRAFIDRMDNAVADLDELVDVASGEHPGKQVFLLGHSMGGCVALSYAFWHEERLAGLVLSAPLAALAAASPITRIAGRLLSEVAPRLGIYAVDSSAVSRDPEMVRDYDADPLNFHGKLPARTCEELASAIRGFPEKVAELELPILTMHGSADTITPPEGSEMVLTRAASEDKSIIRYPGLYHELLNEPEREQVLGDVAAWLDARA